MDDSLNLRLEGLRLGDNWSKYSHENDAARFYEVRDWRGDGTKLQRNPKFPVVGGPLDGLMATTRDTLPKQYHEYNRAGSGPRMVFLYIPDGRREDWRFCS